MRDTSAEDGGGPDNDLSKFEFESQHRPFFAADFVGARIVAPPFLFTPLFRSHTLNMISAEPYTGKTLLCLSMMLCLDTGAPLFNTYAASEGHRCLFIGQDSPTWDIHAQFMKLFRGAAIHPDTPLPSMFLLNRGFSLADPAFLPFITQITHLYSITVIFLDTLVDLHPFDENSNTQMSQVMRTMKRLRDDLGLTVFFTHHTNKPFFPRDTSLARDATSVPQISRNARARGASALVGAIDAHAALDRSADGSVALSFPKGRGLGNLEPLTFSITEGPNNAPNSESLTLVLGSDSCEARIISFLNKPKTRTELREHLQLSDTSLSRALRNLKEKGQIHQITHGLWATLS